MRVMVYAFDLHTDTRTCTLNIHASQWWCIRVSCGVFEFMPRRLPQHNAKRAEREQMWRRKVYVPFFTPPTGQTSLPLSAGLRKCQQVIISTLLFISHVFIHLWGNPFTDSRKTSANMERIFLERKKTYGHLPKNDRLFTYVVSEEVIGEV